jgi:prenyltransferase beta subunit
VAQDPQTGEDDFSTYQLQIDCKSQSLIAFQPDGSFVMHQGGEVDIRSVYCALSAACLTNVYSEDIFEGSELWVVR